MKLSNGVPPDKLSVAAYVSTLFQLPVDEMKIEFEGYWKEKDLPKGTTRTFDPFYGGTYNDQTEIDKIIQILKSATYTPIPIVPDDYELVDISFGIDLAEYDRVVLAYRFADCQLYAFYREQCYSVDGGERFQSWWQEKLSIPPTHYFHTFYSNAFWSDSYFRLPFDRSDSHLIWVDDSAAMTTKVTPQFIKETALSTVQQHMRIEWPEYLINYLPEQLVNVENTDVLYDRYNQIWMVYVRLVYPIEANASAEKAKIAEAVIQIFFDDQAKMLCIYDRYDVWRRFAVTPISYQ